MHFRCLLSCHIAQVLSSTVQFYFQKLNTLFLKANSEAFIGICWIYVNHNLVRWCLLDQCELAFTLMYDHLKSSRSFFINKELYSNHTWYKEYNDNQPELIPVMHDLEMHGEFTSKHCRFFKKKKTAQKKRSNLTKTAQV